MNFDINDLPIICCRATPSDAELEAERDRQHARDVAQWESRPVCTCHPSVCWCDWPLIGEVLG